MIPAVCRGDGPHRPPPTVNCFKELSPARSAQDAAQHAAQYLAADLAGHGSRRLFGHGFHQALTAAGSPEQITDHPLAFGRFFAPAAIRSRRFAGRLFHCPSLQNLVGRLAVDRNIIFAAYGASGHDIHSFFRRNRPDPASGRTDEGPLHRHRHPLVLERGNQRFADTQLRQDKGNIERAPLSWSVETSASPTPN